MAVYPLQPGTQLYETRASPGYRFRVERPIGQGGFGITYLAYDVEFAGKCVVKELALDGLCARSESTGHLTVAPGRGDDFARWLDRFEAEGRQIHRIHHPNVVRVRAVWRERGTAYYAMDLVDGARELPSPDQRDWQPMPWTRAEPIARAILSALDAVHEHGLIHGDVKPSNVLTDQHGRPVLIDFGTVRTRDELRRTVTSTMFTPGYAPPELTSFEGVRAAGAWSDLYSWAMVLWGLLARHPGLEGRPIDAATRILVRQTGGTDPYLKGASTLRAAGMPDAWVDSILACLRVEPEERPASAEAVLCLLSAPARPESDAVARVNTTRREPPSKEVAESPSREDADGSRPPNPIHPGEPIDDTLRAALEDAENLNNRLLTLVRIGVVLHPLLLVALLISPVAIYKSQKLHHNPRLQGHWTRLGKMSRHSLMNLANYHGDDAVLAGFQISHRHAYAPLVAALAAGVVWFVLWHRDVVLSVLGLLLFS